MTADRLADRLFAEILNADPVESTLLGLPGRDHLLADLTDTGARARLTAIAAEARALDGRDHQDRLTAAITAQQADAAVAQLDAHAAEYTVTDLFVAPATGLITTLASVTVADDGEPYLARLAAIPRFLDQLAECHRVGRANGRVPVERLVLAAIAKFDRHLAAPSSDPLRTPTPDQAAADFAARRDRLLTDVVRPAITAYRDVLAIEVLPTARPDDRAGLSWLPGGAAMYAGLAGAHTTTDLTPEAMHETGLAVMAELAEEFTALGSRLFDARDFTDAIARCRATPATPWRDAEEMLGAARAAIARANEAAPHWFGRLPRHDCAVEAVPAAAAEGGPAAYYQPPSLDGRRPGTAYFNAHRVTERDRDGLEAVAFHEGVPGHHLQLAIAQDLAELPMLRRTSTLTAYAEGWGLYAERLADEMGLYSGDRARLGMLSVDARRAARLVVDTGLHAFGWSRQRAIDYLLANTTRPKVEVESDVDRFIALPGQALAYTLGRLEISRIRAVAARALGSRFDLRAFHDVVLGDGALPLSVLARVVEEWVVACDRKDGARVR